MNGTRNNFAKLFLLSFLSVFAAEASQFSALVLHTNDVHGQLYPVEYTAPSVGVVQIGGAARRATLIRKLKDNAKKAGKHVLLLDAGDINTGTFESDQAKGLIDIEIMNQLRYDAAVLGNHEFDLLPPEQKKFIAAARFPILAANVRNRYLRRLYKPYVIKKMGIKKVAIIGLVTQDTPETSTYGRTFPVRFTDPEAELTRCLEEIEGKADFVIVLSHLGRDVDLHLGKKYKSKIDAIVGGHTHFREIVQIDPTTVYVRAGSKGPVSYTHLTLPTTPYV